jgi:hypothetical protein
MRILGLLCCLVLLFSCSRRGPSEPDAPVVIAKGPLQPPAAAPQQVLNFASLESSKITEAALDYPDAVGDTQHPLSLTASDGTGLLLRSLDAKAWIEGPLAFTELHLEFQNPHDRVIEGHFRITLPDGASISRLAMQIEDRWQEAEVVEKQFARRAYEDFLHRRQDPALLEQAAGNEFQARVFPIAPNAPKRLVVSYSQELTDTGVYALPLRGLPEVDQLRVVATEGVPGADDRVMRLNQHRHVPTKDFEMSLSQPRAEALGLRSGRLAVLRVTPQFSVTEVPLSELTVLFDTSASRAPGFARKIERLGQLASALARRHSQLTLSVVAFDQVASPIYHGPAAGFGKVHLDTIAARRPLGASDLGKALESIGTRRALLLTDGIATAGPADGGELLRAVSQLRGKVDRIDAVVGGGIRDPELIRRLTSGSLAQTGIVLDADASIDELARRLGLEARSNIPVEVSGASWVWPEELDGVQPGDQQIVYAMLGAGAPAPGQALEVVLAGQRSKIVPRSVSRPLIERALAKAEIARLVGVRERLAESDESGRVRIAADIVKLSTEMRVLCEFTALLVLETEADYERYGIDRAGLSDILSVGEHGVQLLARSQPVTLVDRAESERPRPGDAKERSLRPTKRKVMSTSAPLAVADSSSGAEAPPVPAAAENKDAEGGYGYSFEDDSLSAGGADGESATAPGRVSSSSRVRPTAAPMPSPAPPPPPAMAESAPIEEDADEAEETVEVAAGRGLSGEERLPRGIDVPDGPPPYSGRLAEVMTLISRGDSEAAIVLALGWRNESPGDVMALIGLGEGLEARGQVALAARAYGSIIDLFPARADLRRFAASRLERLSAAGQGLATDSYRRAVEQRPDHLTGHRLLAFALLREGRYQAAFAALELGLRRNYPEGRFLGGRQILSEDLGLIAAVWIKHEPKRRAELEQRLAAAGSRLPKGPSLRFVLNWETDANDVDFHIYDRLGQHAFYGKRELPSGGQLVADVTNGYGPECFSIEGKPAAAPYRVLLHYYSRGPMGFGMGKLEIIRHDGRGTLTFAQRPFVAMNDGAYLDLGEIE